MKVKTLLENVFNWLLQSKTKKSLHYLFFSFYKSLWKESHGFSSSTMLLESHFTIIYSGGVRKCLTVFG